MKHKVAELEGALLDAAVVIAGGGVARVAEGPMGDPLCFARRRGSWDEERPFTPSQDWEDGGPIIERERIDLDTEASEDGGPSDDWRACHWNATHWNIDGSPSAYGFGPTPLIAAMRAYVSSKFGETVELP